MQQIYHDPAMHTLLLYTIAHNAIMISHIFDLGQMISAEKK